MDVGEPTLLTEAKTTCCPHEIRSSFQTFFLALFFDDNIFFVRCLDSICVLQQYHCRIILIDSTRVTFQRILPPSMMICGSLQFSEIFLLSWSYHLTVIYFTKEFGPFSQISDSSRGIIIIHNDVFIFSPFLGRITTMTSGRNVLQQVWHRLVGVRGATNLFSDQISSSAKGTSNFGQSCSHHEISKHRLVFLGEIHSMPPIIAFQRQVQAAMVQQTPPDSTVHVVMEHFSFELQDLLDDYCDGKLTFEELVKGYHERGEEGHKLEPYKELLEDARTQGVRLHAGFLPRKYARMLLKEGPEATLQAASSWLPSLGDFQGTSFHYNVFESLLSGRSIYGDMKSSDQFRRIFDAQVLKDVAMAHKVNRLIDESPPGKEDKFLVIAGNGHLLHYCGVPERVLKAHPELAMDSCLVISESTDASTLDDSQLSVSLIDRFGKEGSNPADYVYLYEIPEEVLNEWQVKEETQKAYDKVGESAALPGNMLKAAWIMYSMGYTEEQFHIAGPDAYNFQGVGNPHIHAKIQRDEHVLDVGSGLGIDSFIACSAAGPEGTVVGIDISAKEVQHAQSRAKVRGLTNIQFHAADMERIPLPDNSVDVIISNGAFCLVPNKQKAFEELYRVLKPGGRISICTTTTQVDNLEPGVSWPLCMKMFIPKKDLEPLCQNIGFTNIRIDDSDSSMTMEIPEEVLKNSNPQRNRVHVGGDDFKHLENFDMDKLCARVCVVAEKPAMM